MLLAQGPDPPTRRANNALASSPAPEYIARLMVRAFASYFPFSYRFWGFPRTR